jgi:PKD repeat protein
MWYFGDGTSEQQLGQSMSHVYNKAGTYKVIIGLVRAPGGKYGHKYVEIIHTPPTTITVYPAMKMSAPFVNNARLIRS